MSGENTGSTSPEAAHARLSSVESRWTLLFQAHQGSLSARMAAQKQLLLRYYGAVYRYLLGTVRDPVAAEDLAQDFAVRFLRGDFHTANPERGRFRDFLKAALRHLALDYWRKQARAPAEAAVEEVQEAATTSAADSAFDREFLEKWRQELLSRTWEGLAAVEARTGQPYHTVLTRKTAEPQIRSAQLAEELSKHLKRSITDMAARQLLHRARESYADLLVEEVVQSLETTDMDELQQELVDLELLGYCQTALERRKVRAQKKR
jgi:RNA polymerase sigma-70 factor (ECF subfamily)